MVVTMLKVVAIFDVGSLLLLYIKLELTSRSGTLALYTWPGLDCAKPYPFFLHLMLGCWGYGLKLSINALIWLFQRVYLTSPMVAKSFWIKIQ